MKPKTLVLMGVAIACGLGASYMTSRLLAERNSDDEPKVAVLVAKKVLNIGDTIKLPEELFQEKKFTRGEEPPGAIEDVEQLKNRVLKRSLRPGDHVTVEDLISATDDNQMNVQLPGGFRAIGVRVNVESSAFGYASLPLSRVDIISTVRRADDKATYSQVLLENVLVLAADDKMRRGDDGKPMPSQIVTVALKPEDALKVTLAQEVGTLKLMLRKMNAVDRAEFPKVTFEELKTGEHGATSALPVDVAAAKQEINPGSAANKPVEAEVKPPQPEVKPAEPAVVVAKQNLRKHRLAITEAGQTRYVDYWLNERDEVVDADNVGEHHPPRPDVTTEPKKN